MPRPIPLNAEQKQEIAALRGQTVPTCRVVPVRGSDGCAPAVAPVGLEVGTQYRVHAGLVPLERRVM